MIANIHEQIIMAVAAGKKVTRIVFSGTGYDRFKQQNQVYVIYRLDHAEQKIFEIPFVIDSYATEPFALEYTNEKN